MIFLMMKRLPRYCLSLPSLTVPISSVFLSSLPRCLLKTRLVNRRLLVFPPCASRSQYHNYFWHLASLIIEQDLYHGLICILILRCNQQIASKLLLVKDPDVTRSIVQKAVVVLASKPVFGPIRYAHSL